MYCGSEKAAHERPVFDVLELRLLLSDMTFWPGEMISTDMVGPSSDYAMASAGDGNAAAISASLHDLEIAWHENLGPAPLPGEIRSVRVARGVDYEMSAWGGDDAFEFEIGVSGMNLTRLIVTTPWGRRLDSDEMLPNWDGASRYEMEYGPLTSSVGIEEGAS